MWRLCLYLLRKCLLYPPYRSAGMIFTGSVCMSCHWSKSFEMFVLMLIISPHVSMESFYCIMYACEFVSLSVCIFLCVCVYVMYVSMCVCECALIVCNQCREWGQYKLNVQCFKATPLMYTCPLTYPSQPCDL